ncbi:MAG: UvrD-helicase domain-containing protein [bacterium]|nr:UvrD-helicase domain-containing protein [bacterium]
MSTVDALLRDLNPAQRAAVQTIHGPVLVLAGAGTGKTRTITYRITYLLRKGIPPAHILALTFTNKAAQEMRERVHALSGRATRDMQISTFHSFGLRILREHARAAGLHPHFSIYDTNDQLTLVKKALRGISVSWKKFRAEEILAAMQAARSPDSDQLILPPRDALETTVIQSVWERYRAALRAANAVDFEDLLQLPLRLFTCEPRIRKQYREQFTHILVDEYQDTNLLQFKLLYELAREHRNICVVGDDDQSIYGWRGAEVRNILDFERHFPGATLVRLEETYRSTAIILDAANAVIHRNSARKEKRLWTARKGGLSIRCLVAADELSEAELVVADLLDRRAKRNLPYSACAILLRMNTHTRPFEEVLRRYRVPYVVVGGTQFYDRKEIRDFLAYLRVLVNPQDDEALLRIINVPPRGIGETTVERLAAHAAQTGRPLYECLATPPTDHVQPAAARSLVFLHHFLEDFRRGLPKEQPAALARALWNALDYRKELETSARTTEEITNRLANVEALLEAIATYERRSSQPSLEDYLQFITLLRNDDDEELEDGKVPVMTIHASKGLEFSCVYLACCDQGILPHAKSVALPGGLEEERRLFYVAMTRARDELTISYPRTRVRYGQVEPRHPSEFLKDIPAHLLEWHHNADQEQPSEEETASYLARLRSALR